MTTAIIVILVLGFLATIFSWYSTRANLKRLTEMKRELQRYDDDQKGS